jgi:hypothetical protein
MHRAAAGIWPLRHTTEEAQRPACLKKESAANTLALPTAETTSLLRYGAAERHPESLAALVARFGIDEGLLEAIGGLPHLLPLLTPQELAQFEAIQEPLPTPWWGWRLDPAIKAWAAQCLGGTPAAWTDANAHARMAVPLGDDPIHHEVTVIVAGNATGKTSAWRTHAREGLADADGLFRDCGTMPTLHSAGRLGLPKLPATVAEKAAAWLRTINPVAIMSQYPLPWIVQVVEAAGRRVDWVRTVHIEAAELAQRADLARGWSQDKAYRRHARAAATCSQAEALAAMRGFGYSSHPSIPAAWQAVRDSLARAAAKDHHQPRAHPPEPQLTSPLRDDTQH